MSTQSIQSLADLIRPILIRHKVRSAAVFGSQVRGEARPDSDLDLLVDYPADYSLLDIAGLKLELEEALGRTVDLGRPESLYPSIRDEILAQSTAIL